jgi:hypothetical protein
VVDVFDQGPLEVATVADQEPVQAFGPHGAYPSVRRVRWLSAPAWGLEHVNAARREDRWLRWSSARSVG